MDQAKTLLKPNILLAPLDWGLGHATRCIPVIKELLHQNCNVLLAGEGKIKILLQQEFPQLSFLDLNGYNISYSGNKWTLPFTIAFQIPKILSAIKQEHEWLKKAAQQNSIHAIISDNRYGLYHPEIPSVFITHQLHIKTHFSNYFEIFLQNLNYKYINRFTECWVPDDKSAANLSGSLSHPSKTPKIPVKYIGFLSRFHLNSKTKEEYLLILLSGPEPQRTLLENLLLKQLINYTDPVVFVRGLPGNTDQLNVPANISVFNHLPANELEEKMNEAYCVISRCGYSTVMDIAALKKKSILIATPGQTEQEYLAKHLLKMNFALCIDQQKFKLEAALELAASFNYQLAHLKNESHLESAVKSLLYKIKFKHS